MNTTASRSRHPGRSAVVWLAAAFLTGLGSAAAAIEPVASIRQAAERFVQAQMPGGQAGIVVTAGRLDQRLRLPRCAGSLEASLLSGAQLEANDSVVVRCRDGADWTIYVPVSVQSRVRVWVLREPEAQGARLTAADIAPETRLVSGMAAGYLTNPAVLVRSTLRHPMSAGAVLHDSDLLTDFMVRQGEQVTLVASAGGIRVRASGVALQDGRYGALIRVQNRSSLKVIQGTVGSGRVVYVAP
jgi:flagella basal body P-ring formation protein FlgA